MKDSIKCGFVINYTCIKHFRPCNKKIYYRVHLTSFNFEHNHELSNVLKKKVSDSSRKMSSSNVKVLNSVLAVLKYNPKYESTELRNMIRNVVPNSTKIDAQYLNNLRRRAAIYHAKNPHVNEISSKDAQKLIAPGHISRTEAESVEDPLLRANFNEFFRSIMHNDTSTWKAVAFL